jgi:uncharacterized FlaG/YvyC family protein
MEIDPIRDLPLLRIDPAGRTPEGAATRELVTAVREANRSELFGSDRELVFARDDSTHRLLIRIQDRTTGEVLQQMPPLTFLEIMNQLRQRS